MLQHLVHERSGDGGSDRGANSHRQPLSRAVARADRTTLSETCRTGLRILIDWVVTIAGAVLIVLAVKAWVVNPYRIPVAVDGADAPLRSNPAPDCEGEQFGPCACQSLHLPLPVSAEDATSSVFHAPDAARRECIGGHLRESASSVYPGEDLVRTGRSDLTSNGRRLPEALQSPPARRGHRDEDAASTFRPSASFAASHRGCIWSRETNRAPLRAISPRSGGSFPAREHYRQGLPDLLAPQQGGPRRKERAPPKRGS